MISTAELQEFRPDFDNMCQIFEYTCTYTYTHTRQTPKYETKKLLK